MWWYFDIHVVTLNNAAYFLTSVLRGFPWTEHTRYRSGTNFVVSGTENQCLLLWINSVFIRCAVLVWRFQWKWNKNVFDNLFVNLSKFVCKAFDVVTWILFSSSPPPPPPPPPPPLSLSLSSFFTIDDFYNCATTPFIKRTDLRALFKR